MDVLGAMVYVLRALRRSPGLVVTAVLSLGFGIAATTAVFSFVNAIQFKDLPFADPVTLVDIEETSTTELCAGCSVGTAYPTLREWQRRARSFTAMGAYEEHRVVVSGANAPERVPAGLVSVGLFSMLGIQPALGRGFLAEEDSAGAAPVALLSDMLWRRRYAASPAAIGTTVRIDGMDYTIVGVMPEGFRFPEYAQLWTPLAPARHAQTEKERTLGVVGPRAPGGGGAAGAPPNKGV
jgi:hypothetical protein